MRLFFAVDLLPELRAAVADLQRRFVAASDAESSDAGDAPAPDAGDDAIDADGDRDVPTAPPGLRFTDPSQAHFTMKFLGETDADRLPALGDAAERAVDAADVGPFDVAVADLGVFPSLDYISVVWVGARAGSDELTRLHEALEAETTALGFDPERNEFTPHVTVARMDDARSKDLVRRLVREASPELGRFTVDELRLKRSVLTDEGPEYETLRHFPL